MTRILSMAKYLKVLIAASTLFGCDSRPNEWKAITYPDKSDLTKFETVTGLKSFEQCQATAIGKIRTYPDPDNADYECAFKCGFNKDMGIDICKETRK